MKALAIKDKTLDGSQKFLYVSYCNNQLLDIKNIFQHSMNASIFFMSHMCLDFTWNYNHCFNVEKWREREGERKSRL